MSVKFNDLHAQWKLIEDDSRKDLEELFLKSSYINGPQVKQFEDDFSDFIGCQHSIGVSSGTDAIKLAAKALQLDGKVGIVIPANTFIATILAAEMAYPEAEIVLIDHDEYYQIDIEKLENVLKIKRDSWDNCLIIPVHLYGHCADMKNVMRLSNQYKCYVLEDASQSHGTVCEDGRLTGNIGHISAFSLYPGKNLGALGDAGIVTTNDKKLAENVSMLRNYGSQKKYYYEFKGYNNRMDSMQAIFLKHKLKHLRQWNYARYFVAQYYNENIINKNVNKPKVATYCKMHTYHIYCVRVDAREGFMEHLNSNQVQCGIHYPIPIEMTKPYLDYGKKFNNQNCRTVSSELVSLPMHPFMSQEDMSRVCDVINNWNLQG